jgi:hypothetical protein
MMAVLAGKLEARRADCAPVAGKSTLNRLELSRLEPTRYHKISHNPMAIKRLFVDLFLEAHGRPAKQIILDLDATDDPVHGNQEGRFFHGYYDCYCYLPLYVFCGRDLLAAKLRRASVDAAAGAVEEVARIVAHIRRQWQRVRILVRADSGFAREELMAWCEANGVDFLFGLAKNDRLNAMIKNELEQAAAISQRTGKPARRFKQFMWTTRNSWSHRRRVVAKAEWTQGEANPRFVVTLADAGGVQGSISLRENLLRPRRHGKSHQGMPTRSLCRSYLDRHDASQPDALVVCLDGLRAALCLAPHRTPRHRIRQGDLRHHSSQAAQNRCSRAHQRAPHQSRDGIRMSRSRSLGARCRPPRRLGKSSRLARLTRVAAKRTKRGIIPRPTEINSSLPTQPGKVPENLAPPDATVWCARHNPDKAPRKIASSCNDMVR